VFFSSLTLVKTDRLYFWPSSGL